MTLTNKTLTSPVLTTPQINDTSSDHQYVFVASELAADRNVTLPLLPSADEFTFNAMTQTLTNKTLTSPVLTTPTVTTSIQASTNAADVVLNQFDGVEVARIFDGGLALPTYATLVQTAKGGFGYRKSVIAYTADSSSNVLQLTAALSGSSVLVNCASYSGGIKLPVCATAAEAGMHFEFYLVAANGGSTTFYVETGGADGNDEITGYIHNPAQTSAGADITIDTAGDKITFIASTGLGAHISITNMVGDGTTERWVAHIYTPTDHLPTVAD